MPLRPTAVTDSPTPPVDDTDAAAPSDDAALETTAAPQAEAAEEVAAPLAPPPTATPDTTVPARNPLDALPAYSRSLLKVKVPVVVTLASRTESIENITNMGPGTILQFDKSCEDPLELAAGGQPLALGEAVKVGDKFGLRILSMVLPHERFRSVGKGPSKKAG